MDHKIAGVTFTIEDKEIETVPVKAHSQCTYENAFPPKQTKDKVTGNTTITNFRVIDSSLTSVMCSQTFRQPFVCMICDAYNNHHHLVLRPDDIWIAIMIQFGLYVQIHAENLRSRFVVHDGKKPLAVVGETYGDCINALGEEISSNLKDATVRDWVLPSFSTTTTTDRIVGTAALMSAMKEYFSYSIHTLCGIPRVTLQGTKEDWIELEVKARKLVDYDLDMGYMKMWYSMLGPILSKFTECFTRKEPDKDWWNRICSFHPKGSGSHYLTGWITAFCIFGDNNDKPIWQGFKEVDGIQSDWAVIPSGNIPSGVSKTPITLECHRTKKDCILHAGHIAFEVGAAGDCVQPRLDWFLVEPKVESFDEYRARMQAEDSLKSMKEKRLGNHWSCILL